MTTKKRAASALSSPGPATVTAEAGAVRTARGDASERVAERDTSGGHLVVRAATLPVRAAGALAGDLSGAARRPDAVLYWGGLAGLAALGVLDWPVAATIGVGVAVAYGLRRTRT